MTKPRDCLSLAGSRILFAMRVELIVCTPPPLRDAFAISNESDKLFDYLEVDYRRKNVLR
jgi:hypothetical protein